jgi:hypothetical protein
MGTYRAQLRFPDYVSEQVIEGKIKGGIEVTGRRKKLLDDLKEGRGYSHL